MLCPVCKKELKIAERSGIEIDYCPECRGIWLDRGELDKIIDRSARFDADFDKEYRDDRQNQMNYNPGKDYNDRRHDHDDGYYKRGYNKKKKGFFDDLFDF